MELIKLFIGTSPILLMMVAGVWQIWTAWEFIYEEERMDEE